MCGLWRNSVPPLGVKRRLKAPRGGRSIKWPLIFPNLEVLWLCTMCHLPAGIKSRGPQWALDSLVPKETLDLTLDL